MRLTSIIICKFKLQLTLASNVSGDKLKKGSSKRVASRYEGAGATIQYALSDDVLVRGDRPTRKVYIRVFVHVPRL